LAIITFTSDFGLNSFMPAAVKGLALSMVPGAELVDIGHQITPYNYNQAAYVFGNAYRHFPANSYHVVLFNLFDALQTKLLMVYHGGHYLILPDNGLLTMLLETTPEFAVELPIAPALRGNALAWARAAVQGIAQIEQGAALAGIGPETDLFVIKHNLRALVEADYIDTNVIYIDAFENVVVNLTEAEFETARKGRNFTILIKGDELITRLSTHYAQVSEGSRLAMFNCTGYLEIAVNKGNAAGLFGLRAAHNKASKGFMESRMFYQTVRIIFDA
jgi:S-adenosylmethionine hydrolase